MLKCPESQACHDLAVGFEAHTMRLVVYDRPRWQQDLRPGGFSSRTGWCTPREELTLKGGGTPVAVFVARAARVVEEHK